MVKTLLFLSLALTALADPIITVSSAGPDLCIKSEAGLTAGVGGFGSFTILATTLADYNFAPGIGPADTCTVTVSDELVSTGSGPGFLGFSLNGDAEADPTFYVDGVIEGACGLGGCFLSGTVPITLGTPFEISLNAEASRNAGPPQYYSSLLQAAVQESAAGPCDGCFDYQTISEFVAPEPSAEWLVAVGIAAFGGVRFLAS